MAEKNDPKPQDRQAGEHPGVEGEKVRVPEHPEQPRKDRPIGNGAVDEPAAFPPHN